MGKKSKTGGGGRKIGRKKRKMSFQRYKQSRRWLKGLERHVLENPNDGCARSALARSETCSTWVAWRTKVREERMGGRRAV